MLADNGEIHPQKGLRVECQEVLVDFPQSVPAVEELHGVDHDRCGRVGCVVGHAVAERLDMPAVVHHAKQRLEPQSGLVLGVCRAREQDAHVAVLRAVADVLVLALCQSQQTPGLEAWREVPANKSIIQAGHHCGGPLAAQP